MTNKSVIIINSLKVPKIKKILLYEIKFLVPNYSCLQNPWLGSYRSQIRVLLVVCPQLNLLNPPPLEQNSWVRHWRTILVISNKLIILYGVIVSLVVYAEVYLDYCHVLQVELHKGTQRRCSNRINRAARMEWAVDESWGRNDLDDACSTYQSIRLWRHRNTTEKCQHFW